jgi:pimeloyl-ACP methyl ester carboxylesterase
MMGIFKMLFILLTGPLAITSMTVKAQETSPAPVEEEVLLYAAPGLYAVGRTWFLVNGETENPLIMVAWYPAVTSEADQAVDTLTIPDEYHFPNEATMETIGTWGSAVLHAVPDTSNAPYPLVIFSTGGGLSPNDYLYLLEHLASYGFIVATPFAPDSSVWASYVARPLLIPQQIDFAAELNTLDGSFKGLIDAQHVGIVGHSVGGYTALTAAGAQLDMHWFETWCAENRGMMMADYDCPQVLGHQEDMMALANIDTLPSDLWPSWRDPRVSAIVSQSIPAQVLGPAGLASVSIPVMIQFGSDDREVGSDWAGYQTYESVSSTTKAQVVFEWGNHMMFTGRPSVAPRGWATTRVHDLVNHFTTAFLLDILKGDQDAHQALLPDAANFANVTYSTTMQ